VEEHQAFDPQWKVENQALEYQRQGADAGGVFPSSDVSERLGFSGLAMNLRRLARARTGEMKPGNYRCIQRNIRLVGFLRRALNTMVATTSSLLTIKSPLAVLYKSEEFVKAGEPVVIFY
jgi:hypothetical protein